VEASYRYGLFIRLWTSLGRAAFVSSLPSSFWLRSRSLQSLFTEVETLLLVKLAFGSSSIDPSISGRWRGGQGQSKRCSAPAWPTRASAADGSIVLFYDIARQPEAQPRALVLSGTVGLEHILIN
jgi:hypothetical protein